MLGVWHLSTSEWPVAVIGRSSVRYRHWPFPLLLLPGITAARAALWKCAGRHADAWGTTVDFYRFMVTNFKIDNTRSLHEDTLYLSHTVHVDDDIVTSNVLKLGDFNKRLLPR